TTNPTSARSKYVSPNDPRCNRPQRGRSGNIVLTNICYFFSWQNFWRILCPRVLVALALANPLTSTSSWARKRSGERKAGYHPTLCQKEFPTEWDIFLTSSLFVHLAYDSRDFVALE